MGACYKLATKPRFPEECHDLAMPFFFIQFTFHRCKIASCCPQPALARTLPVLAEQLIAALLCRHCGHFKAVSYRPMYDFLPHICTPGLYTAVTALTCTAAECSILTETDSASESPGGWIALQFKNCKLSLSWRPCLVVVRWPAMVQHTQILDPQPTSGQKGPAGATSEPF